MRGVLLLSFLAPALLHAQEVTIRDAGDRETARIIRESLAKPHVLREGSGRLDLPRDSTIGSTLVVIGRPTYLASTVNGDVVVIGSDLFVHPGARVSGRVVAIGGTVVTSALATVGGTSDSFRDERYVRSREGGALVLRYERVGPETPVLDYAGLQGLLAPAYDRVNGLSMPVGAVITLAGGNAVIEPRVTYRSRLGTLDPRVDVTLAPDRSVSGEITVGRDTRSNDRWIYSDLVNSILALGLGSDMRNYFRSAGGEARVRLKGGRPGRTFNSWLGARQEDVRPISTGSVFSFIGRNSIDKMRRPNPLVEVGTIRSALLGAEMFDTSGVVVSRLRADVERSIETVTGTGDFTQVTLDGKIRFPTFRMQALQFEGHLVTTMGSGVAMARHAYLGGSGTLALLEKLEQGGDELVLIESRYVYPLDKVVLKFVGTPVITLKHIVGAAGVGKLPALENELGVGVGLSALHIDFMTDVSRGRGSKISLGIKLGS